MKKIVAVFVLSLFITSWLLAVDFVQSYKLSRNLQYRSEELFDKASELEQDISSYLTSPDWNEQKILGKIKDFRENCEQLYSLSADYYNNERNIYRLLDELTGEIEYIIEKMKRTRSLKRMVNDAVRCSELIIEYKKAILNELVTELTKQSGDFISQVEDWIDSEQKSQQKLLENVQKFDQTCQNVQREVNAYFFDLFKIKDLAYQAYDLSKRVDKDLKKQTLSESIARTWDICIKLTENFKNTTSQLATRSSANIEEIEEEENYPPEGYLDMATRDEISGWAFDIDAGVNPIEIHIYINENHAATVIANEKRDDLMGKVSGLKEPYHGFRWKPKDPPAGRLLVKVYAINVPKGDNPLIGRKIIF